MKKFFSIAALALAMSTGVQAQTDVVPNRMIINSSVASKAYAVDHVDSISFARKDGEVKANVEFLKYEKDEDENDVVYVKVTRTDPSSSFKIEVLPTTPQSVMMIPLLHATSSNRLPLLSIIRTSLRANSLVSLASSQPTLRTPLLLSLTTSTACRARFHAQSSRLRRYLQWALRL